MTGYDLICSDHTNERINQSQHSELSTVIIRCDPIYCNEGGLKSSNDHVDTKVMVGYTW